MIRTALLLALSTMAIAALVAGCALLVGVDLGAALEDGVVVRYGFRF